MLTNFLKKLWIKPEDQSTLQDNLYFLDKMDWSLVKKTMDKYIWFTSRKK